MPVATKHGVENICDLFVLPKEAVLEPMRYEDLEKFLDAERALRSQDRVALPLDSCRISQSAFKKAAPHNSDVHEFLAERRRRKGPTQPRESRTSLYH